MTSCRHVNRHLGLSHEQKKRKSENVTMSWPLVYRVAMHVWFALQLCNLRSLLCPSQPQYCYGQVGQVSQEPPALQFALLPLTPTLCIKNSACSLRASNPSAQPRITFIVLSTRSMEDTQWKQDP